MKFSEQLKIEKERLGMTLAQFYKTLTFGERTINHWLAGTRIPHIETQEGVLSRLRKLKN